MPKSFNIATWEKEDRVSASATDVWFYGDGHLLYKATNVTSSMPFSLDIDTKGVNLLTIKIKTQSAWGKVALTDLALYK